MKIKRLDNRYLDQQVCLATQQAEPNQLVDDQRLMELCLLWVGDKSLDHSSKDMPYLYQHIGYLIERLRELQTPDSSPYELTRHIGRLDDIVMNLEFKRDIAPYSIADYLRMAYKHLGNRPYWYWRAWLGLIRCVGVASPSFLYI